MTHWLFLPDEVMDDLATLASIPPGKLPELCSTFDSSEFQLRYSSFMKVADLLSISDEAAARICTFLDYVRTQRAKNKKPAKEVIGEFDRFLRRMAETDEHRARAVGIRRYVAENQELLATLFSELPEYEHSQKVRGLEAGPLPHLGAFKAYCDLRPVFDASADQIVSSFPVITLRLTTHSSSSNTTADVLVQLTEEDIKQFKDEFDRLEKKLARLKQQFTPPAARKR